MTWETYPDVSRAWPDRQWVHDAVARVEDQQARTADTPMWRMQLPAAPEIDLYLKDESAHPTGSLKHRLASSLVLYGLVNGWIGPDTTLVEASSGSTAVSEAFFARLLGLRFVAVLPRATSAEKVSLIEAEGGRCHFVDDPSEIYEAARRLAADCGGHYLDQFTYAERATDWRGNNNIAESIVGQLRAERHPAPRWVVVGAGTGGTSATLGRFLRFRRMPTDIFVVDPEGSAFFDYWRGADGAARGSGSRIEGIGRPRPEPSFLPRVIDRMMKVPDYASVAAMRAVERQVSLDVGPSTGTAIVGVLTVVDEMLRGGEAGSVVTLVCDRAERYRGTFDDDEWLRANGIDVTTNDPRLSGLLRLLEGASLSTVTST